MRKSVTIAQIVVIAVLGCFAGCSTTPIVQADTAAGGAPEYRIGAGDILSVFVWNHPELSSDMPVRPDGRISAPLIEEVEAAGKTPPELAHILEGKLSEFVRSPRVNVIVKNATGTYGDQIRVVGQAAHPQALPYKNGMTVLDVMIAVGGLAEFAAGNRATISRSIDGKLVKLKVRLQDLIKDGDITANVPVLPGDVLIIPESHF
jgi:polysaccharide export outer membrane protein